VYICCCKSCTVLSEGTSIVEMPFAYRIRTGGMMQMIDGESFDFRMRHLYNCITSTIYNCVTPTYKMPCSILSFSTVPPKSKASTQSTLLTSHRRRIDHRSIQLQIFYQYNMSDTGRQSMTDKASSAMKVNLIVNAHNAYLTVCYAARLPERCC
jgi:hypothetical protein